MASNDSKPKQVMLWTVPRSMSTAFTRSMCELPGIRVFPEPFGKCYYYGPDRVSKQFENDPVKPQDTYENVAADITGVRERFDIVFVKEMAYYFEGRINDIARLGLADFKHTFLIRRPDQAVPSFHKAATNVELTGFTYFDPKEAGFEQLYELYLHVKENYDPNPLVLDAADLKSNPELVMETYCNWIGVPFNPSMTVWERGPLTGPGWEDFSSGWYETLFNSSGFFKSEPSNTIAQGPAEKIQHPTIVAETIEYCQPFYEKLRGFRYCFKEDDATTAQAATEESSCVLV